MEKTCAVEVGGVARLGERGQIVLPLEVRKALKLKKGDQFYVFSGLMDGTVALIRAEKMSHLVSHISKKLLTLRHFSKSL